MRLAIRLIGSCFFAYYLHQHGVPTLSAAIIGSFATGGVEYLLKKD